MTEEALQWQALRQGSREAFEWLFQAHYGGLVRYGTKLTPDLAVVEDAIQNVFLKLWQRKERLPEVVSGRAYLFKALKRALVDVHRARRPGQADPAEEPFAFSHEDTLIEQQTDERLRAQVGAALNLLTKRQREALYLKFQNEMGYEEISDVMGLSNQAARNLVYQALKFLREKVSWMLFCGIFMP
jgi:RNA polymerase sigma factor (sigma-70 family)